MNETNGIMPIRKQSLPDGIVKKLRIFVTEQGYKQGDRLPSATELARMFEVGVPTLREAIKKLETINSVEVKHGSGMFVGKYFNRLFLPNPVIVEESLKKEKLLELIDARIAIESRIIHLAMPNLTAEHFTRFEELLKKSENYPDDYVKCALNYLEIENMMRKAANNTILFEIVIAITNLYSDDQLEVLNSHMPHEKDYELHRNLLTALKAGDEKEVIEIMETRFKIIRDIIDQYM
ncbi:MAG: GntR family transcriptional regulator [Candidatus Marinimicrobia bacterium]|jgi:GntR family transcriptional repressor for pyruvate dehydrogenase complex|nr:GntR family transcriptional regulator [Candidatus Neomarinimicrobiota bacterium]